MSKPHRIDVREVKARADGRWEAIMSRLAPNLAPAIDRRGKHVPCPIHGGTDGFRLMKKFDEVGSGVCNTCGVFKDGFSLLMFARQYSFRDALEDVAREVGLGGESKDHIPLPKPCSVPSSTPSRRMKQSASVFAGCTRARCPFVHLTQSPLGCIFATAV